MPIPHARNEKRAIFGLGGRERENAATRHGGTRPDFPRNFPPGRRAKARGEKRTPPDGEKKRIIFLLTYWHSLNITRGRNFGGGKNYASTPQRALPKRHGSFLHNSPAAKRANDRSVSARGQRRNARKRSSPRSQRSQTRRRTRRFAFCASTNRTTVGRKENDPGASPCRARRDRVSSGATDHDCCDDNEKYWDSRVF